MMIFPQIITSLTRARDNRTSLLTSYTLLKCICFRETKPNKNLPIRINLHSRDPAQQLRRLAPYLFCAIIFALFCKGEYIYIYRS